MRYTKSGYGYIFVEDNGGGLHVIVYNSLGKALAGVTELEHAEKGEWENVRGLMNINPLAEVMLWDNQFQERGIFPQRIYDNLDLLGKIVCKNGDLYPSNMGAAARRYFGV